jgi:hypothetical protein
MPLFIEERPSDSPFIERIWRSRSENINSFISIASYQWDFVISRQQGEPYVNLLGPETHATHAPVPDNAEFFGIVFKPGVFMSHLPAGKLVNNNISLPDATGQSFWLNSEVWQLPTYDNVDTFVDWLVRDELLVREPVVNDVLKGFMPYLSLRSVERRFLHATGLSQRTIYQIERARRATILLQQGTPIVETAYQMGYFDHAHLTKSLKHYIGQTPTQIMDKERAQQLSLLYKTDSLLLNYDPSVDSDQQRRTG